MLDAEAGRQRLSPLNKLLNGGWNLKILTPETGPTRPARPLCESETAGTRGGQKCGVITQSTARADPPPGLTETGQTPTMRRSARARPPGGSSRQLRNVRIEIRQGLQLEGEFQPSSFLSSLCLVFASLVHVCLRGHPGCVFSYCSCSRARVGVGGGFTQAATSERDGK